MANKAVKNAAKGFFGMFNKADPAEKKKEEQDAVSKLRASERHMIAQLEKIKRELRNPQNKLPQATIEKFNIAGVIEYAIQELSMPLIIDQDLTNLDKNIDYIIKALEDSVKEGREKTAEWACTALVYAIKNLRTDIAGVDEGYADEMMECRVNYSTNLQLLVESCIQHDYTTAVLAEQNGRRKKERDELDRRKNHYQARVDSGALRNQLAELEQKAHNPASMSDAARDLRDELFQIHLFKASVLEIETSINASRIALNGYESEIKTRRNALAAPPHVVDEKRQERIDVANRLYRESLRKSLNRSESALRSLELHSAAMKELANHSVHIMSVAMAQQMAKEIELERLQQQQAELQAAQMQARAAENLQIVKDAIKAHEQERIHVPIVETVQEPEREVIQNVEYDFG